MRADGDRRIGPAGGGTLVTDQADWRCGFGATVGVAQRAPRVVGERGEGPAGGRTPGPAEPAKRRAQAGALDPGIGKIRLDRLRVSDVQSWLNKLQSQCQCCAQGKDAKRAARDPTSRPSLLKGWV